jgi:hypothetical protein
MQNAERYSVVGIGYLEHDNLRIWGLKDPKRSTAQEKLGLINENDRQAPY